MIKIAFFDVDGTLIKLGTKELSDKTEKALTKLRQNNVLLCMATGRSYPTIPHFQGIDFDVLLTFNGSYVKSGEKIIFKNPLHNEDKNQIIQNLKNMKRAIAISNENFIVTNGTDEDLAQYFAIGNETMIISDDFDKLSQNDIYQIMCAGRKEEYEKILQGTKNAQVAAWWDKAVDIIPANGGKGNAVNAVLKYYGFSKEEAIALINQAIKIKLKAEEIEKYTSSFVSKIFQNREADTVYKYKNKNIFFLIEHQTKIDYSMPYRILEYEIEIMKSAIDIRKVKNKEYKLPLVIPIVLYTGKKKWNAKRYLEESQETLDSVEIKAGNYNLVDINDFTKEELLQEKTLISKMMLLEKSESTEESIEMLEKIIPNTNKEE